MVVPGEVQSAVVLADRAAITTRRGTRRCRRFTSCCWRAWSRTRRKPAGAEKLRFIRSCSASLPPQVMHDLEAAFGAPVLEAYGMTEAAHQMSSNPLPPGDAAAGIGRAAAPTCRSASWTREGKHLATGERGEVVISGPNVIAGLREQSRGERHVVRRRMVPDRRSGLPRRERLSDADRPPQGNDQSRRREDLSARDRRGSARASGGRRGRLLRRAAHRRGARKSPRRSSLKRRRPPRPTCSPTARSGSPTSSVRSRFTSPTRFRAPPPARSSVVSWRRRSRQQRT